MFIKHVINIRDKYYYTPRNERWNCLKMEMIFSGRGVQYLTKCTRPFDYNLIKI